MNILEKLNGCKTYIIGFMMMVVGVYNGDNELILQGVGLITLRSGIKNLEK